jgi:hypothetical protein
MIVDSRNSNDNFDVGYVERVNLWVKNQVQNFQIL